MPKNTKPSTDGIYYSYQPNGTQSSPDFRLFCHGWSIDIDMKQSNTAAVMLNDGWFKEKTVYLLSYRIRGKDFVMISLGQYIPSEEENKQMLRIIEIKNRLIAVERRLVI